MNLRPFITTRKNNEHGIYLVVGTALIVLLLLLAALVIGLGFLSTSAARMQRVSNLVALAALENFSQNTELYQDRASSALDRANTLFAANPLPGFDTTFGGIGFAGDSATGGDLELGQWLIEDDGTTNPDPCSDSYPCFSPNPHPSGAPAESTANAVRVRIQNSNSNPLRFPLEKLFAGTSEQVEAEAIATIIQRCVVFVVDTSLSTYFSSHYVSPPDDGRIIRYGDFATQWTNIAPEFCGGLTADISDDVKVCSVPKWPGYDDSIPPPLPTSRLIHSELSVPFLRGSVRDADCDQDHLPMEYWWWCNLTETRDPDTGTPPDLKRRYQSDYIPRTVWYADGTSAEILVDSFIDDTYGQIHHPRPFGDFFLGFNAGLRKLNQQRSASDRSALLGMKGNIGGRYPIPASNGGRELTDNIGILIQITNLDNRGTITWRPDASSDPANAHEEVRPNFLDYGIYSLINDPFNAAAASKWEVNTNLVLALNTAASILTNECSASSQKIIVLASDGISTCSHDSYSSAPDSINQDDFDCAVPSLTAEQKYDFYEEAETQITEGSGSTLSVIDRLKEAEISVVSLISGEHLGVHFLNQQNVSGEYMDPAEQFALGGVAFDGGSSDIFDITSQCSSGPCDDQDAFLEGNGTGTEFRRPIAVLAELALETGGIFCPLMPQCDALGICDAGCTGHPTPSEDTCSGSNCCYVWQEDQQECRLASAHYSGVGNEQRCSTVGLDPGAQAARCVTQAIGGSPYILVAENN
jgi:hypothetical protein